MVSEPRSQREFSIHGTAQILECRLFYQQVCCKMQYGICPHTEATSSSVLDVFVTQVIAQNFSNSRYTTSGRSKSGWPKYAA